MVTVGSSNQSIRERLVGLLLHADTAGIYNTSQLWMFS